MVSFVMPYYGVIHQNCHPCRAILSTVDRRETFYIDAQLRQTQTVNFFISLPVKHRHGPNTHLRMAVKNILRQIAIAKTLVRMLKCIITIQIQIQIKTYIAP